MHVTLENYFQTIKIIKHQIASVKLALFEIYPSPGN